MLPRLLLSACLLGALSAPAQAAWPTDPYSGNVPVSSLSGSEDVPRMVSDGAGGCIVVWRDFASSYDLRAQRFDRNGNKVWTANGVVVVSAAGTQSVYDVAPDGSGGALIVWRDDRNVGTTGEDLYAQRLNSNGTASWTANGVAVCTAAGDQESACITSDGTGGAFVAWTDLRTPANARDIYVQRLSSAGSPVFAVNGQAVCTQPNDQFELCMAPDGTGALLAWTDLRSGTNFDVYLNRVSSAGAVWITDGRVVCNLTSAQRYPDILADGTGGAYVVWSDLRSGLDYDIYAQRLTGTSGIFNWGTNGVLVNGQTNAQLLPRLASDGLGGFITVWQDDRSGVGATDLWAQRMTPGGTQAWSSLGVAVCTAAGTQQDHQVASDGAGGALAAWLDTRLAAAGEIYAARIAGTGSLLWSTNGVLVSSGFSNRVEQCVVSDGDGGALLAWTDYREAVNSTVLLQRVERYGFLGDPAPRITQVRDTPNDQGGSVRVSWARSHLDADPTFGVTEYRVFRSVPPQSPKRARAVTHDSDVAVRSGALLVLPAAVTATAWEYVGTQLAEAISDYSRVVATVSDSIAGSNPRTLFMVEARATTALGSDRWFSPPDSGYSVDNLAPLTPAPFTGFYSGGATRMAWNPNHESDLAGYRLYRGSSVAFVPSPANLVSAQADTGAIDAAGAPYVYKLTAIDVHGNESPVATLLPAGVLDAGDAPGAPHLALMGAAPNPLRGAGHVRYALSRAGEARLSVIDVSGREVALLARGTHTAGEHAARWSGRDARGQRVAAGVYFMRLAAEGQVLTARVAVGW